MYVYIGFKTFFLRCPTPRLHCFLSSHWPSFRFLSFMAFFIPSIQFFFGLPRALFCFGIHFNAILGSLSSAILWTWPQHVSWFCSISFIIVSSSPNIFIRFLINSFLMTSLRLQPLIIILRSAWLRCNIHNLHTPATAFCYRFFTHIRQRSNPSTVSTQHNYK